LKNSVKGALSRVSYIKSIFLTKWATLMITGMLSVALVLSTRNLSHTVEQQLLVTTSLKRRHVVCKQQAGSKAV